MKLKINPIMTKKIGANEIRKRLEKMRNNFKWKKKFYYFSKYFLLLVKFVNEDFIPRSKLLHHINKKRLLLKRIQNKKSWILLFLLNLFANHSIFITFIESEILTNSFFLKFCSIFKKLKLKGMSRHSRCSLVFNFSSWNSFLL